MTQTVELRSGIGNNLNTHQKLRKKRCIMKTVIEEYLNEIHDTQYQEEFFIEIEPEKLWIKIKTQILLLMENQRNEERD